MRQATATAPDTAEVLALQEEYRLAREIDRLMASNRMAFYRPNGAIEAFIRSIAACHPRQFCHAALLPNRLGKGVCLTNILGTLCLGPQSEWFESDFWSEFPRPHRGRIIGPHEGLDESMLREMPVWLPRGSWKSYKNGRQYMSLWEIGGCVYDVLTVDQDLQQFESASLDVVLNDEPQSEDIFNASIARLQPGGVWIMGATPLDGLPWLFDKVGWETDPVQDPRTHAGGCQVGNWNVWFADMEAACQEHGVRGHWPHEWLEKRSSEWSDEVKKARTTGRPIGIGDKVFEIGAMHIIDAFAIPENWPKAWALDTHFGNKADCAVGIALSPAGDWYVYDEAILDQEVAANATELRYQVWKKDYIDLALIDPMANIQDPLRAGASVKTEYDKHSGITWEAAGAEKVNMESGIRLIRDMMSPLNGKPRMYFFKDRVPYTIWEMRRWRRDKATRKPVAEDNHQMQNLYRLALRLKTMDFNRVIGSRWGQGPRADCQNPYLPVE